MFQLIYLESVGVNGKQSNMTGFVILFFSDHGIDTKIGIIDKYAK